MRSATRRLGERLRDRLRMSSCCLTSTDSATTDRAPPGPASRATVANRCRKRTARSRTAHPSKIATPQKCNEFTNSPCTWSLAERAESFRFLTRDQDQKFTDGFDNVFRGSGIEILCTPFRAPQANAFCERLIGTIRRECLDWLIVLNERHLRFILRAWVVHYNHGRPHASLGPGIPDAPPETLARRSGHHIVAGHRVTAAPILAGLHHEYRLDRLAA